MVKRLAILGSTGSIGRQTLDVVRANRDAFTVTALTAHENDALLADQVREFRPATVALTDADAARRMAQRRDLNVRVFAGDDALIDAATLPEVDVVVTSVVGFAGLRPTLAAIDAGKDIALANKETLVVGGELVMAAAKARGVRILPVDSEHCALFQCLRGERRDTVERLVLTCSGGAFRGKTRDELAAVTVDECLRHPTWSMGAKITVDSATLVNKGFEVIEAHWLYGVPYERIAVVVHPQSVVHSMVEFRDGAVMAQLATPDMRLPIQYALTYPTRRRSSFARLDFASLGALTFGPPDTETFRGLPLAYEAGKAGGSLPCTLNAANEVAVAAFLRGDIGFLDICAIIERAMATRPVIARPTLAQLIAEDRATRELCQRR